MTITTLGTSHGDHTASRFNSSTALSIGDQLYVIDAGEPITALLTRRGLNIQTVRAVFITHMHADHVGGLPTLLKTVLKYAHSSHRMCVFLPEEDALDGLGAWLRAQHIAWPSNLIDVRPVIVNSTLYADQATTVRAMPTEHLKADARRARSFGYVFEAEGRRIVFTGDLAADFRDFPISADDPHCDVCVCEAQHYRMEDAVPVLKRAPIRRLVFNHIADRWHGDGEAQLRALASQLPYPFEVAYDGYSFSL